MILDLRQFETFPVNYRLESGPNPFAPEFESILVVKSAAIDLNIQKVNERFYCRGKVEAEVQLECVRCLSPFDASLEGETDFIACSEDQAKDEGDVIDDEDYAFFRAGDMQTDISDLVRQALILAVGMKPLCGDDCKGICPQCGVNLNQTTCNCVDDNIDERWSALKKLTGQE